LTTPFCLTSACRRRRKKLVHSFISSTSFSTMINSLAIVALLSSAALAQTATNSLIPSGISSGCTSFLNQLNSDSSLSSCLAPLNSAVAPYGPGGSGNAASMSGALTTLCTSTTMCDSGTIRNNLGQFQTACSAELQTSPNKAVIAIYDALYVLTPLKAAVCSQDSNGKYCVTESNTNSSTHVVDTNGGDAQNYLWQPISSLTRRDSADTPLTLNQTTWASKNIAFLGLDPSLPQSQLCTACTRAIITPYISFESSVPYAPGLAQSAILSGQPALYSAINSLCGASFLSGAVQAAGGLGDNGPLSPSNGAHRSSVGNVALLLGSAALGVVSLF
jgi:hypothetical protein